MSAADDTDNHSRMEPLILKHTTLPHGICVDSGAGLAGGERIEQVKRRAFLETCPSSTTTLVGTLSQTSQFQDHHSGISFAAIFLQALRIILYLVVIMITVGLTLATCKFTDVWDPCEHLYINTTECKVTSYLKGMVYYTDCTESYFCVLPGFENTIKRQSWSVYQPKETVITE